MPGTGLGVALGSQLVGALSPRQAKLLVGGILSIILAIGIWQELPERSKETDGKRREDSKSKTPAWAESAWFAGVVGIVGGFATILTNSMGPMLNVFLLTQKLEPTSFVGTRATFFSTVNLLKVGQRVYAGTLTWSMMVIGVKMGVLGVIGVLLAKMMLKRMSKSLFTMLQYIALTYSSFKLLYSALA